jgi:predicted transcriptional regulator
MAMTVRLPADLDARLETLAATRHVSKHALLIEATERFMNSSDKTERVLSAVEEIGREYADALRRLEDA